MIFVYYCKKNSGEYLLAVVDGVARFRACINTRIRAHFNTYFCSSSEGRVISYAHKPDRVLSSCIAEQRVEIGVSTTQGKVNSITASFSVELNFFSI